MTENCTDPLDLFNEEVYHDDLQVQIRALKKLPTLAGILGASRARHELIPVLEDYLKFLYFKNNNTEVLSILAEQLGKIVPLMGGAEYGSMVLPMLQILAGADDAKIIEKSVESLVHIASLMNGEQLAEHFVKLIRFMSESIWLPSKCIAAALVAICYVKLSEDGKSELRCLFFTLMENESFILRREAAKYFPDVIKLVEMEYLKGECVGCFRKLSEDDEDSVRLLAVNASIALASRLTPTEIDEYILEILHILCVDPSWRVRYQFAKEINSIQTAVGPTITRKSIVVLYKTLIRDNEASIREISARKVVQFCELLQKSYREEDGGKTEDLDPTIKLEMLPLIEELDKDVAENVQYGLHSVLTPLSSLLGEIESKDFLLPLITNSIQSNSLRVKENIISSLNSIMCVIGIEDLADGVRKLMIDLMKNNIWRTRRNLIVTLCHIARHSTKEYFDEHLNPLYVNLLNDTVYGVRKVAPLVLPVLVKHFGTTWATQNIIQTYLEFSEKCYYLLRMMCLFGIDELIFPSLEKKDSPPSYLEILKNRRDLVRSKMLYRIKNLSELLTIRLREEWVSIILSCAQDECHFKDDVRDYAEETLEAFNQCGKLEITKITEDEICKWEIEETYLEGLLFLILGYFLDKIYKLALDKVQNVRARAVNTLRKVHEFNTALGKELDENWVENWINLLSPDDRLNLRRGLGISLLNIASQRNKFGKLRSYNRIEEVPTASPMEIDQPPLVKDEQSMKADTLITSEKTEEFPTLETHKNLEEQQISELERQPNKDSIVPTSEISMISNEV